MLNIIKRLMSDTNNNSNIIYRKKTIFFKTIYIIYDQTISSSDTISNFIIRSLNHIHLPIYSHILNKISNFKYQEISTYQDITYYLNNGFTILLISKNKLVYSLYFIYMI